MPPDPNRPFFSPDGIRSGYTWSSLYRRYVRSDAERFQQEADDELTDADRAEMAAESRWEDRRDYA